MPECTGIDVEQIRGTSLSLHPAAGLFKNPPDVSGLHLVQSEVLFLGSHVLAHCARERGEDPVKADGTAPRKNDASFNGILHDLREPRGQFHGCQIGRQRGCKKVRPLGLLSKK